MKKTIRFKGFALMAAAAIVISACGPGQQQSAQNQEATHEHDREMDKTHQYDAGESSAPAFGNEQKAAAYQHYTHLKEELVASDKKEEEAGYGALRAALQEVAVAGGVTTADGSGVERRNVTGEREDILTNK